jgi:hypothetical protein
MHRVERPSAPHGLRGPRAVTGIVAMGVVAMGIAASCRAGPPSFPWPGGGAHVAAESAEVRTLNENYDRTRSGVLVREIDRPTRAALDYAAYHANFMIADLPPDSVHAPVGAPDTSNPFGGMIERATLTGDVKATPMTESERTHSLAFAPAVEYLHARRAAGAEALAEVGSAVRSEGWGLPRGPEASTQGISEIFLHAQSSSGDGGQTDIWVKIEFVPWFKGFRGLPDQDGDGFPELYGRVRTDIARAATAAIDVLQHDYMNHVLTPAEVKAWANQLASYWYPSFNTDLIEPGAEWPDERTEPDIKRELADRVFRAPAILLRGKPQGRATYNVFLIPIGSADPHPVPTTAMKLPKTRPTPQPQATVETVTGELAQNGGSWTKWVERVAPLHEAIRARLRSTPVSVKAFAGADGFLFYRNGLDYVTGGDLEKQRTGKNPLPVILEFKRQLESHDVDFLFVSVPTKEEIFPDALDPRYKALAGQVVNPFSRKFALSLARAGVEIVDLLPAFLAARATAGPADQEPLYQHQDTHWTDRGLSLAADLIATRVQKYPWYREITQRSGRARIFASRETSFTRFGDLHSRLPDAEQKRYQPETLLAHQVIAENGAPYEDDPDSPIVVLGDSFTGVYELTDAEHAGVSAHIAKAVSIPVDLVMSYGGGPNVRQKLLRRGLDALASKRLVVWIMTARDLYNYWEDWEPLGTK